MQRYQWEDTVGHHGEDAVLRAMQRHRRADFLPKGQRRYAGMNRPVDIGYGQTNSQPATVASMLRLLDVQPGHVVLDVGAGSGWSTAILGDLVTETGSVLGLDIIPDLVDTAQEVLECQNMPWISMELAEVGVLGAPTKAPFDRILVSAEASHLPRELVEQLTPRGIMVMTVSGQMLRVERRGDDINDTEITQHGAYRFVDLITD